MSNSRYIFEEGPQVGGKILLHVCCAPCSCAILEGMKEAGMDVTVYFYNPNIHPQEEYEKRKAEVMAYAARLGVPVIDADYDTDNWFSRVKGLEGEPERGRRCSVCFGMRLARTALYASENGFSLIATSLSISRHKNQEQVHQAGHAAVAPYAERVRFWDYNWRSKGGAERGNALAKEEGFYRQNYCGCMYSVRGKT